MKLFELIDIFNMVDEMCNNKASIKDFGIDDKNNVVWVNLDNGKDFDFILNREELDNE